MSFASTEFLFVFLPIVLILYFNPFITNITYKNAVLLCASIFFYAWGEPIFIVVILLSVFSNWKLVERMLVSEQHRKAWLVCIVLMDVMVLFIFKYLNFVTGIIGDLMGNQKIYTNIALPIGISFYTFQIMSYVFDSYYNKIQRRASCIQVAEYALLFPQLIAGPIVRYNTIANEIVERNVTELDITEGTKRFVIGLGKKAILANYVALIADNIFETAVGNETSIATAWLGAIAYTYQIYFDFSGYSDMAIGLGKIFGFHFEENFNYPYISGSVTEFWRRWHISLSSWFKEYVYIPLGGSRVSKGKAIRNLFAVWALTGIWHGANWTYIIWGLYYFFFILFERKLKIYDKKNPFTIIYTSVVVVTGWTIFRAESIQNALNYLKIMFGANRVLVDQTFWFYFNNGKIVLAMSVFFSLPILKWLHLIWMKKKENVDRWNVVCPIIENVFIMAVFFVAIVLTVNSTYNPFIYFNF